MLKIMMKRRNQKMPKGDLEKELDDFLDNKPVEVVEPVEPVEPVGP